MKRLLRYFDVGNFQARVIAACLLVMLVTAVPRPGNVFHPAYGPAIQARIDNPWDPAPAITDQHSQMFTYRLTVPLIAKGLQLPVGQAKWIDVAGGILLLLGAAALFRRELNDRTAAGMMVLSLVFIYAGKQAFYDTSCYFDGVAIGLLFAALGTTRPWCIGTAVFLSAWTDERGLIASAFVALYWWLRGQGPTFSWRGFARPEVAACLIAWVVYFATRTAMVVALDIDAAISPLPDSDSHILALGPLAIWSWPPCSSSGDAPGRNAGYHSAA